jgi:hypothetical protein
LVCLRADDSAVDRRDVLLLEPHLVDGVEQIEADSEEWSAVENSLTGIETSPKEMLPDAIGRAAIGGYHNTRETMRRSPGE